MASPKEQMKNSLRPVLPYLNPNDPTPAERANGYKKINQLNQEPPVKAQNKAKMRGVMMDAGEKRLGSAVGSPVEGEVHGEGLYGPDDAINEGRRAMKSAPAKTWPSRSALKSRLPGALGMLDAAQVARDFKDFKKKPYPVALGIDGEDL